ncbi:hypothetical protein [Maribacter luteus]|uniref:Uncharacterized protein n=1 Tax=Maribacter luteus TaxID=2594478 RepID=A0A6I2MRR2_9FLAO|nr:hypothetical protein [Maribacter luteus]MRX65519.1 hypothetical protein [Maribacter luteus]
MIDELDLLKKDWQKRDEHLPKLSFDQIHSMIWKKSSSIVRWILIISILEFTLPHLLYLIPSFNKNMEIYDKLGLHNWIIGITIFSYGVAFYFLFQFYRRYKEICVLDSAKSLMKKIIRTRRTVKHYIIYSLSMIMVIVILMIIGVYLNDDIFSTFSGLKDKAQNVSIEKIKISLMIGMGIMGIVLTAVMGGIYFLLYGLLLRKLKRNYNELKQLEV